MKKIVIAIVILLMLLLAGVYWFIPDSLTVNDIVMLRCSARGANRTLLQKENWKKFWIGEKQLSTAHTFTNDDLFLYKNDSFRIINLLQNALSITISNGSKQVNSLLMILPLSRDSAALNWSYTTTVSANPFTRIQQYQQAVATKKNMEAVLQNIRTYLSTTEHVYGISIKQATTHDTTLVSTNTISKKYPTTEDVYALVRKLQSYIAENGALQTGSPMLNVTQLDSQQYKIMVALPTNKKLSEQGDIIYKRMVPGQFLTATVTGGVATVNRAYRQMQYYFDDYQRIAMAIPFQILVTDRTKQTDTTQWVTKLYFPVM